MVILSNADLLDGDTVHEGQIKYTEDVIVRTGYNAEAAALIPFGRAVTKGNVSSGRTSDRLDLVNLTGAGNAIVGIAVATDIIERRSGAPGVVEGASLMEDGTMAYPIDYTVSYLVRGVIGVRLAGPVTPASPVYVVHTASEGILVGTFQAGAVNAIQIPGARFLGFGAQDEVVPVSINLA
ncbi:MAG TPA: hypothetical protein V6D06_14405 [Trichocoleus sp.]